MKLNKVLILTTILTILCFIAVPVFGPSIVFAEEKGKLIKVIDKSNLDEIKDDLPVSHQIRISEWGMKANLREKKDYTYEPPPGFMAATELNRKSKVVLDPEKGLLNYYDRGGWPFPDPKDGTEIIWNGLKASFFGDDFDHPYVGHFMGPRGDERSIGGAWTSIQWVARTDVEPLGSFQPNPDGIEHKETIFQTYPFELKGTSILTVRFMDPKKADNMWIYVASLRRIRRMSASQRCDTYIGSDFIYDDFGGMSWKGETADYKLLEEKEMWIGMNNVDSIPYSKGKPYPQRIAEDLEKRPCYIVEVKHHDPNYVYGRRVVYIDKETYTPVMTDVYDTKGNFWKSIVYSSNIKDNYVEGVTYDVYDIKARCCTLLDMKQLETNISNHKINNNWDPSHYTTAYLKKLGR